MFAKDIMTSNVVSIGPDMPIGEIAKLLLDRRISGVPVVSDDGALIGLVSEGDLIRRAELGTANRRSWWLDLLTSGEERAADYVKTHGKHARDVMTKNVVTVEEGASMSEIAALLEEKRIKRVPVVRDGKVVGIVSRSNLLQGLAFDVGGVFAQPTGDLRSRIQADLDALDWLHPTQLNVIVADDVVEIWGDVESPEKKSALRIAVENVEGVGEIRDHVSVTPHFLAGV